MSDRETMSSEIADVQPASAPSLLNLKQLAGDFVKGLWVEMPLSRIMLGLCPALAVTTSAVNGVGMGVATAFVLTASNIMVSIFRKIIPDMIRIPAFIIVIASFVTITDLMMAAFTPDLHQALGIFIPLIVVNCLVLARAEAFASKNTIIRSVSDGLGMGIGFTLVLALLGSIREILGNGTWFDIPLLTGIMGLFNYEYQPMIVMILPPGAFIGLGLLVAIANMIEERRRGKK